MLFKMSFWTHNRVASLAMLRFEALHTSSLQTILREINEPRVRFFSSTADTARRLLMSYRESLLMCSAETFSLLTLRIMEKMNNTFFFLEDGVMLKIYILIVNLYLNKKDKNRCVWIIEKC